MPEEINTPMPQESTTPIFQEPEIVPVEKPKKKWPLFVLIAVLLVGFGAGGLFAYQKFFTKSVKPGEPMAQVTPTPVDETVGWKTYTSEELKITFRHPAEVSPVEESGRPKYVVVKGMRGTDESSYYRFTTGIVSNVSQKSFADYVQDDYESTKNPKNDKCSGNAEISVLTETTVANQPSYSFTRLNCQNTDTYIYFFLNGLNIYQISISVTGDYKKENLKETNKILSTFKFLDSADETVGWKEYKNNEFKFIFKYPADWEFKTHPTQESVLLVSVGKIDTSQDKVMLPGDFEQSANYLVSFNIEKNYKGLTLEQYVERRGTGKFERFIVDGANGLKYKEGNAPSSGLQTNVAVLRGDYFYNFSYGAMAHKETHEKYIGVFDKILSTFKFTE